MLGIRLETITSKILPVLLPLTCATFICGRVSDPDLWFHLTIGRWILAHNDIPTQDYWSFYSYGNFSLAYSWLFEALTALLDLKFGNLSLWVIQFGLALFLVWSLIKVYSLVSGSLNFGILFGSYTSLILHSHFALRPQSFVWIIYIWIIYFLDKIFNQSPVKEKKYYLYVAALLGLWANLHISLIIGVIAIFFWASTNYNILRSTLYTILLATSSLFTPFMGEQWYTLLSKASHPLKFSSITEFHSIHSINLVVILSLLLVSIFTYLIYLAPRIIPPILHMFWFGLLITGSLVVKFLPFAVITITFFIAKCFADKKQSSHLIIFITKLKAEFEKTTNTYSTLFFTSVLLIILTFNLNFILISPIAYANFPVNEVTLVKEQSLPTPILNNFEIGGYLMYRFSDQNGDIKNPKDRVIIDGRTNLITPAMWHLYEKTSLALQDWDALIKFAMPDTIIWHSNSDLIGRLLESGEWCKINHLKYDLNSNFSLLVRRTWFSENVNHSSDNEWSLSVCEQKSY